MVHGIYMVTHIKALWKPNPEYYKRKVIDIGCNGWDYEPLSYNEKKIMSNKEISEHH
jgi:hypothetical protein